MAAVNYNAHQDQQPATELNNKHNAVNRKLEKPRQELGSPPQASESICEGGGWSSGASWTSWVGQEGESICRGQV